ncbi:MAG: ribonuclease HII [Pseudomonadota bacterium]
MPDLSFEHMHAGPVCGADEVGRGPWAGPVIAAAVILPMDGVPAGIDDSKKLSASRREALFGDILACAHVGIGRAEVEEINARNILVASEAALTRAVAALPLLPHTALIDGKRVPPGLPCPGVPIVKGDSLSLSIAAASIIAKVTRDREMRILAQSWPGYGWETNMGYGTRAHAEGLQTLGVSPHHRRSFKPIHKILG